MHNIPKTSGIYAIHHKDSGKLYVGSSVDMQKRLREHFRLLKLGKHANQHLQAAWDKFGESAFECRVIEYVACADDLYAIEQMHLDAFRMYGYNKAKDTVAPQRGLKRSDETCAKIGASKIGNKNRLGAVVTEEMRNRIASKLLGTKASPETKAKLSAQRKGKKKSKEWCEKMSQIHKGRVISQEQREAISAKLKGRKVPQEALEKRKQFFVNRAAQKAEIINLG